MLQLFHCCCYCLSPAAAKPPPHLITFLIAKTIWTQKIGFRSGGGDGGGSSGREIKRKKHSFSKED